MIVLESLIVIAAAVAGIAGIAGLFAVALLWGLEEREHRRHTHANALARRRRTRAQMPPDETIAPSHETPRPLRRAGQPEWAPAAGAR
jgi:hypothetical protein